MLLARPIPLADESQGSILMRAAYLNGWQDAGAMLRGCCGKYNQGVSLFRNRKIFQDQIDLLGIDLPSGMDPYQLRRASSAIMLSYNSQLELPCDMFRAEGSAVCPRCIQDFPYLKRIWSLRLMSTCDLHGCLLVQCCRQCALPLDWNRPAPHLCRCSFDLRQTPTENGDISVAKVILDLVENRDQKRLTEITENFFALERFFSMQDKSYTDEQLSCMATKNRSEILVHLVNHVVARAGIEHPRVALAPLLRSPGNMRDLAIDVLREVAAIEIPAQARASIYGTFNIVECAAALGLSKPLYVMGLHRVKLIDTQSFAHYPSNFAFTKASIDALLRKLWAPPTDQNRVIRQRPLTEKIPELALDMLARPSINAGYDLEKGLCGLRRLTSKGKDHFSAQLAELWTIEDAAKQLNAYPKIVRSLLRTRRLKVIKVPFHGRSIFISKTELARFDQDYVFVGTLAKSVGASRTQFIQYLASHGVKPVGGPGIDELVVYLVARKDVAHLDLTQLRIKRSGLSVSVSVSDKSDTNREGSSTFLTISEVATQLNLSVILVGRLVRDGKLERVVAPTDAVAVSRASFELLRDRMADHSFKSLKDVLARIHENREEFIARWITTGIATIVEVGNRECISKSDHKIILDLKRRYMTAKEAAIQFDRGRSLLPNLEARGLISAIRMGHGQGIKLFRRSDVAKLMSNYQLRIT